MGAIIMLKLLNIRYLSDGDYSFKVDPLYTRDSDLYPHLITANVAWEVK